MAEERSMLVVDDEEVVCQVCRRIFTRQGFQVDTNTDARRGLAMATEKEYSIILLDVKMPNMDGIEFLQRLREKHCDVPVLIITGYPSIPNAAAAMRLGACDYVTKPFTSEEITWAVERILGAGRQTEAAAEPGVIPPADKSAELLFWEEAWLRQEIDGWACVGAVLPPLRGVSATGIRLPKIGEVVYQGLPLAGVMLSGKPPLVIPSPVTGVVVAVNEHLNERLDWLWSDPCGEGCVACVSVTRHEEIQQNCRPRRVLLVNAGPTAEEQAQKLTALGCQVQRVADRDALAAALADTQDRAVFLDAASFGDAGPALAAMINERAPSVRIVVVGAPAGAPEPAYRKHKIFYYAVEPFSDNEIAEILNAVFQTREVHPPKADRGGEPSEPISSIAITNRNGHKVQLLSAPGLLWRNEGLGCMITQRLLARMFPVVITPGEAYLTPGNILSTATTVDRLMVLLAKDSGLLPGSLVRNTKPDFGVEPGEAAGKVTTMAVQPDDLGGLACLDSRTLAALADHIVWDMASY